MGRYRHVETRQEEISYEARIWWALWAVALVVLLYTAYHHSREYDLVHNGQCIEAEYYVFEGREKAKYWDENNNLYMYDLSGMDAVHGEDTVLLYYKEVVALAEPHRDIRVWLYPYLFSGFAISVFSWILYRIYHRID